MPNFIVLRPFIYVFGTIIDPNQNNPNETTIYGGHNTSMNGTTGHTHTGAVGDGPLLTFASFGGILHPSQGGTGTSTVFTEGSVVFAGPLGVYAQDNANFFWNDAANRLGIGTNSPAGTFHVAGGPIILNSTQKLFLDGGVDTFIQESSANVMDFFTNNVRALRLNANSDVVISQGNKIYLDGGTNDFIQCVAANQGEIQTGGVRAFTWATSGTIFAGIVQLVSGQFLSFSAANNNSFNSNTSLFDASGSLIVRLGGVNRITFDSVGEMLLPSVDPPTANYGNRNSFVKGWVKCNSAGGILASYNVSSVTKPGTGVYNVNWNTNFNNANYVVVGTVGNSVSARMLFTSTQLAGSVNIRTKDDTGTSVDSEFHVIAVGAQ